MGCGEGLLLGREGYGRGQSCCWAMAGRRGKVVPLEGEGENCCCCMAGEERGEEWHY